MLLEDVSGIEKVLVLCIVVWLTGLTFLVYKSLRHYKKLVSGSPGISLDRVLERLINNQSRLEDGVKDIKNQILYINKKSEIHIQKIGLVKFSPYSGTGGNQSFALSLLNERDTGVVLLSLHGRDGTRIYIKKVIKGSSIQDLSKEEKEAIKEAKNGNIKQ